MSDDSRKDMSTQQARRDRFDDFADEVEARIKAFTPMPDLPENVKLMARGFTKRDMAFVARQWFASSTPAQAVPDEVVRELVRKLENFVITKGGVHECLICHAETAYTDPMLHRKSCVLSNPVLEKYRR